jgi:DNA-binding transcriptional MerR regulator
MERLTVGELAQASGLSPATIRRYGSAGVLPPVEIDAQSGYRYYSRAQVEIAVLARTLRQLDVPLDEVRAILEEPDAASRLARLERHWRLVSEQVERGRRERDHVARLFSGFQDLIDSYEVWTRPVEQVGALVRRRIVTLFDVPDLTRASVQAIAARAAVEERSILGQPVLRYGWPPERPDVDNAEAPREVEVCLPVSGDPDVVLPGGVFAGTDVRGEDARFPQLLAAYGAVSQWARGQARRMLGPALEVHIASDHFQVGWLVTDEPSSTEERSE